MAKTRGIARPFESEIAFAIIDNPEDTAQDIEGISSILEYDFKRAPPRRIVDTYFDLESGSLRDKRISLRVRKVDETRLLTMKSSPQKLVGKGIRRVEIELPWTSRSLTRIARELGITPPKAVATPFPRTVPSRILARMGLEVIQERLTRRETRNIVLHGVGRKAPLAELAIDDVAFLHEDAKVRFFDIEIEAKAPHVIHRIQEVANALYSLYPASLRPWTYGKFMTGLAIRRLLKRRVLQNYLVRDHLMPRAFPLLEQTIQTAGL